MEFSKEFTAEDLKQCMLDKPKRLIEYVDEDPFYVLKEVFNPEQWAFISKELRDWLIIGLSSDYVAYDDWGKRLTLVYFYDQLLLFVEALFIIHMRNMENTDKEERIPDYKVHLLSKDQITNPKQVIVDFFGKCSTDYILRELNDWLIAGLAYPGSWRDNMVSKMHVYDTYHNVLCLIKSAKRLLMVD
jgi:hypothetical protein